MQDQLSVQNDMLLNMNEFIQRNRPSLSYHITHIKLVEKYALILHKKLNSNTEIGKINYMALCHDILKERGLNPKLEGSVYWRNHNIPQDLNRYVRMNLDVLDEFNLSDYFNTDIQLHALAAGIFIRKELNITDPEILSQLKIDFDLK